ncbi:scavenger receptor class B member 1-like [Colletes gigas]|uniref:scavenger receptor class B member 1-like n=1 Tax=Colletes gigas TaxID=935657 RepID=UPI001C9AC996|nr:scavenger receptor class B member 1-like [Colletes gigas]XP_043262678.1 scavenger receptor class B member 1-like [Colletes gigas]XP_043262679.1 scavenger receptor class B member 1-like [Colletes gigas]
MKLTIPLQQFKKCILLFLLGTSCSILAYIFYIIHPVKAILEYNLHLRPNSLIFNLWRKPPINVYIQMYIFNITNEEKFLKGEEKLKVEEIGPYVYQEILENQNVTWHNNGTISYIPKRTVVYVPEMSVGDPEKDLVRVPNIPMLGLSSTLHDAGFFVNYPWANLVNLLNSKPILNITVYDYLWGYEDTLVNVASTVLPSFIDFRKFGLLDRIYDEGENVVFMNVEGNKNMTDENGRYLSIETYNGSPGLAQWGYNEPEGNETHPENTICNRVQGSTEGELFPGNLDKRTVFRVFRKSFCRAIPIVFKEQVLLENGFEGYLYSMSDDFLDPPDQNPENKCFCSKLKKCLKKGLSDITPCYYSIPAAMSLPHFLNADPSLLEGVEGLNPDPEKHTAKIILEPTIGIPMKVNSRIQVNLVMYPTKYNHKIKVFNDMTIPLFWSDLTILTMPDDILLIMKLAVHVLPIAETVIMWLLAIAGVTMIVSSIPIMVRTINQQQTPLLYERRDSTDLRIPLNYGQYTTMRILPAIKKITSKTDLFS